MISKYALIGNLIPARASVVRVTTLGTQLRVLFNRSVLVNANGLTPDAFITTLESDPTKVEQDGTNQVLMTFSVSIPQGSRLYVAAQPNWTDQAIQANVNTTYVIE